MQIESIIGMDRETGRALTGYGHVRQSVIDILTTLRGERVLNRDYGSDLPDAIDKPIDGELLQFIYAATATAIAEFYPMISIDRIAVENGETRESVNVIVTGAEGQANGSARDVTLNFTLPMTTQIFN